MTLILKRHTLKLTKIDHKLVFNTISVFCKARKKIKLLKKIIHVWFSKLGNVLMSIVKKVTHSVLNQTKLKTGFKASISHMFLWIIKWTISIIQSFQLDNLKHGWKIFHYQSIIQMEVTDIKGTYWIEMIIGWLPHLKSSNHFTKYFHLILTHLKLIQATRHN